MAKSLQERTKQVFFMPWIGIKAAIRIEKCEVWPFTPAELATRISNTELQTHLQRYFDCYVDHSGSPVKTVAVCFYEGRNFTRLRDSEAANVQFVADIIMLSAIAKELRAYYCLNNNVIPPSSDRFQLLTQMFTPGDDNVAVSSGKCISGGWRIGDIKFSRPWCLGGAFLALDEGLIEAFNIVFSKDFPKADREKLRKSLEWFRLARTESEAVTEESKIVMMATALEIILDVPETEVSKQFAIARWLDANCSYSASIRRLWKGQPPAEHSLLGHWSRSFYACRNKIVHGSIPSTLLHTTNNGKNIPHLDIAALVFWECIVRKLYDRGAFKEVHELIEATLPTEEAGVDDQMKQLLMNLFHFGRVHRAFGWLPPLLNQTNLKITGERPVNRHDKTSE